MLTKPECLKLAKLSRIKISDNYAEEVSNKLSSIFNWIDQLNDLNVDGIPTFADYQNASIKEMDDVISDGKKAECIVAHAPDEKMNMFAVPKVVE